LAWTNSKVFVRWPQDLMGNTTAGDMDADVPKVALYNTTTAPDQTVTAANTAYAVGQWVTGNEITDATGWHVVPLLRWDPVGHRWNVLRDLERVRDTDIQLVTLKVLGCRDDLPTLRRRTAAP
jgi:hypothetical protein